MKEETSLAVVHEYKLMLSKQYLFNVIIDDRFLIKEFLGDGFTGFVRNGKTSKNNFKTLNKSCVNFMQFSGIDLKTGKEVAIKFATKKRYYSLEKEFVNYLYLGADGEYFCLFRKQIDKILT